MIKKMDETEPAPKRRGRPKGSYGTKRKAIEEAKRLALEPVPEEESPEAPEVEVPEVPEEPEAVPEPEVAEEPEVPEVAEVPVPEVAISEDEPPPVKAPKAKAKRKAAEAPAPKPKRIRKAPVRAEEIAPDERTYLERWKAQEKERLRAERMARISRYDMFFQR